MRLLFLFHELLAGFGHILQEFLAGMQTGIAGSCQHARGIDIALPVVAGYYTALPPLIASLEQFVLGIGVDLTEQQGHSPSSDRVA